VAGDKRTPTPPARSFFQEKRETTSGSAFFHELTEWLHGSAGHAYPDGGVCYGVERHRRLRAAAAHHLRVLFPHPSGAGMPRPALLHTLIDPSGSTSGAAPTASFPVAGLELPRAGRMGGTDSTINGSKRESAQTEAWPDESPARTARNSAGSDGTGLHPVRRVRSQSGSAQSTAQTGGVFGTAVGVPQVTPTTGRAERRLPMTSRRDRSPPRDTLGTFGSRIFARSRKRRAGVATRGNARMRLPHHADRWRLVRRRRCAGTGGHRGPGQE